MTKRLILIPIIYAISMLQIAFAQDVFQLTNAGFEEWENGSTSKPVAWNTYETVQCSGLFCTARNPDQCKRSTDVRTGASGKYSVVAIAKKVFGIPANGIITTGVINAGATSATDPKNHNESNIDDPSKCMIFTGRPDSVVAWIKAKPKKTNQLGRFYVMIHDNNYIQDPGTDWSKVIAIAGVNPPASDNWVRYSCPFFYEGQKHNIQNQDGERTPKRKLADGERPSYVLVTFSTNYLAGEGTEGDEMYGDDIEMIYNSQLTSVAIDGTNVEGFSKDVYAYNVAGKYTKGAVTYKSNGRYATIEESYNETNKTLTLTVKGDNYSADNTNKHVYTFTFGCDAKLNNFKIDGNQLTDFSSDKFDYTINRVYENVKSKISYEASSCARVTETWDEENNKLSITVAGDDTKVYTFQFHAPYGSQLKTFTIAGKSIDGFAADKYDYSVANTYDADKIKYSADEGATIEEKFDKETLTLTITVKGGDIAENASNTHTYTIQFHAPYGSILEELRIDGASVKNFSSSTLSYNTAKVYKKGTTKVTYKESAKAIVSENFDEKTFVYTIVVKGGDIAENSSNTHTYTIQFHAPYGSILEELKIDGTSVENFASSTLSYTTAKVYKKGTTKVTCKASAEATVSESFNENTMVYTIIVKGGDFAENASNTHTYTIQFHAPYGSILESLKIDGASVKNFSSSTLSYNTAKVYKEGTTKITYKASSEAIVSESFDEKTLVYTIVVKGGDIAENATNTHTYTIQFHAPYGSHLKSLTIGGKAVDGFSPTQYTYNINTTYDKNQLAFTVDDDATYETSYNKNTLELTITVNGGDIDVNASNTHKYIIQYHAPYEAKLTQLNIDGEEVSGFNQSTFAYNSAKVYKEGTTKIAYTASDEATVTYSFDAKTLVYTLVVNGGNIAENPDNTNTYTIQFHAPYGSQLKSISVAGKAIEGFSPSTYKYSVANTYKASQFECEADEEAKVEKSFNSETFELTVTVKGGDFAENPTNVHTYVIQYHAPYESYLTDLSINGETINEFSSTKYSYSVQYVYAEGIVSYKSSLDASVEENYNAENQTYTIIVKGGDFAENTTNIHTYTINFHDSYGSQLKSLTVNLNSVANFAADKYEYIVEDYYEDGKVKYTLDDTEASATERFDATTNKLEIVVKGGDYEFNNSNTHTYTLQFWAKSLLTNISYNGNTVPAFRQDKYEYRLTEYAYEEEKITYTVAEGATANTKYDAENNTLEIEVIGSDIDRFPKNKHTYKVVFRQPSGSYLTSIRVNETELESFNKTTFNYLIKESYKNGMIKVTQDENASVSANFKEETNQYVIVVKGGDYDSNPTNTHTYTLQFYAPSTLSSIRVNNVNIAGFEEDKYEYVLNNIVYKNANIIIKEADNATVEQSFDEKTNVLTIIVKGSDIATYQENFKVYKIQFSKPLESQLTNLKINGTTIEGFDRNTFDYVSKEFYQEGIVTYVADSAATVTATFDKENYRLTLIVKGGDYEKNKSNIHTYTISFEDPTYYGSQLTTLTANGVEMEGFAKDVYEYVIDGSYSDVKVDYVGDELSTVSAKFDVEKNALIIIVEGGNIKKDPSNVNTYTINFTSTFNFEALVTSLKINGVEAESFNPNRFNCTIAEDYSTSDVTIEVSQLANYCADYNQTTRELTIVVWAGDFEKNNKNFTTYKVTFKK
jgi:hypothetical protein